MGDSLYQRLKELDPDTFQKFCFQLLKEQHPGLEVRHVEGAAGDEGIDVFAGELFGQPTIWQCKSFPNGVGKSQREQIRKSLRIALEHFSPTYWILCLSVDMDIKARRWFERLKTSCESKVKIGEMFASDFINEVFHRRTLRNHFFPNAALDVVELKRLVSRTGEMRLEELERVTDANLEDIIERWKERDARFNYQIVFDGDLGPPKSKALPPDGLVMSVSTGAKKLNVFARDIASLQSNPPTFSIQFKGTGIEKIMSVLNTGAGQEFNSDELGAISTDWALLSSATDFASNQKLIVAPSPALTSRKRNVQVLFRQGDQTVQYGLMELSPVRAGRKEGEFTISGKNVPFAMSFVTPFPPQGNLQVTIQYDGKGREIREIKKALDALSLLRRSGQLDVIDLETEKLFLSMTAELSEESPKQGGSRKIVNELVDIADRFRVNLIMPHKIVEEDYASIALLKRYISNGTAEVNSISVVVIKSEENKDLLPELLAAGRGLFRFTHPRLNPPPKLFGTSIDTGPLMEESEAEIKDFAATLQAFRGAAIGSGVKMSFRPLGPVRFSLLEEVGTSDRIAFNPSSKENA